MGRYRKSTLAGGASLCVLLVLAAGASAAKRRPDLVQGKLSNPPQLLPPGASFKASDIVTNRGRAKARASTTRYYLDTVAIGSRRVPALKPRKSSTGSAILTVPDNTADGTYTVRACADANHVVRESKEGNNCRAAATQLTVKRPPPPASSRAGSARDFAVLLPAAQ